MEDLSNWEIRQRLNRLEHHLNLGLYVEKEDINSPTWKYPGESFKSRLPGEAVVGNWSPPKTKREIRKEYRDSVSRYNKAKFEMEEKYLEVKRMEDN